MYNGLSRVSVYTACMCVLFLHVYSVCIVSAVLSVFIMCFNLAYATKL